MTTPAMKAREDEMIPRFMVRAMFGLVIVVLGLVTLARLTDRPLEATPPVAEIAQSRTVFLDGDMAGNARVLDGTGTQIANLSPTEGGFVSGVWRVLERERAKTGAAPDGPVIIARAVNGRLSITDPSTGWSADLMGFGTDNAKAFARLLDQP